MLYRIPFHNYAYRQLINALPRLIRDLNLGLRKRHLPKNIYDDLSMYKALHYIQYKVSFIYDGGFLSTTRYH